MVHVNMSLTLEEALVIQERYYNFNDVPFKQLHYSQAVERLKEDHMFESSLLNLKVDFISYEAFYDLHSHVCLNFDFNKYGGIFTQLTSHSLRLDNY